MDNLPGGQDQPLSEALILWCDKQRLTAVIEAQAFFSEAELRHMSRVALGGAPVLAQTRQSRSHDQEQYARRALDDAWDILIEDFQRRIQTNLIYLTGVETRPTRQEARRVIPNVWAADFDFDFFKDAVTVALKYRFVAVTASTNVPQLPATPQVATPAKVSITPEAIAKLTDEQVLALLEAHADWVTKNDGPFIAPTKVSFGPIIRRKMEYRAASGELEPTLIDEMKWLAAWIATKVNGYHTPTPKPLANALRNAYRVCKAQSKGMKP